MYPRSRVGKRTEGAILGGAVTDYIMDRSGSASIVLVWGYMNNISIIVENKILDDGWSASMSTAVCSMDDHVIMYTYISCIPASAWGREAREWEG